MRVFRRDAPYGGGEEFGLRQARGEHAGGGWPVWIRCVIAGEASPDIFYNNCSRTAPTVQLDADTLLPGPVESRLDTPTR